MISTIKVTDNISGEGYPSESVSSSKWHVWFASRCPGRRLSTWQMISASCPDSLRRSCGHLMFRLTWCSEHSAVMATELLQPLNRATMWNSLPVQLRNPDITYRFFRRQLKGHLCK